MTTRPPPNRLWALAFYGGIALLSAMSIAGCLANQTSQSFGDVAGPVTAILTIGLGIGAIVVFARHLKNAETFVPAIVGIVFSATYASAPRSSM